MLSRRAIPDHSAPPTINPVSTHPSITAVASRGRPFPGRITRETCGVDGGGTGTSAGTGTGTTTIGAGTVTGPANKGRGVQLASQDEQRTARPGTSRSSGTSYDAAQDGQTMSMAS